MTEADVRDALKDPNKFKDLFKNNMTEVKSAVYLYPQLKQGLFNAVLHEQWASLVKNNKDLLVVCEIGSLPEMKVQLIQTLESFESDQFTLYFQTLGQLRSVLDKVSTVNHDEERLVERIFFGPNIYLYLLEHLTLFDQNASLIRLVDIGREYCQSDKIRSKICEEVTTLLSEIPEYLLFDLIKSPLEFRLTVNAIKYYPPRQFIERVLNTDTIRKKYFKNVNDYLRFSENVSSEMQKKVLDMLPLEASEISKWVSSNEPDQLIWKGNNLDIIIARVQTFPEMMLCLSKDINFMVAVAKRAPRFISAFESKISPTLILDNCYADTQKERLSFLVRSLNDVEKKKLLERILINHITFYASVDKLKELADLFPGNDIEIIRAALNKSDMLIRNEYDISLFIERFPSHKNFILNTLNQSANLERLSKFSALILSVQKPFNTEAKGVQPGKTGLMINEVCNGGYIYLHRDKQLSEDDKKIANQHLHPGGWFIVTGHGSPEGKKMSGGYHVEGRNHSVDISITPQALKNLLLKSNRLKSGDHINIVLYSCYAAEEPDFDEDSLDDSYKNPQLSCYAAVLASELDKDGITSRIVASNDIVDRIGDYQEGDVPQKLIKFRTQGDIMLFSKEKDQPIARKVIREDIYFGRDKIHFGLFKPAAEVEKIQSPSPSSSQ